MVALDKVEGESWLLWTRWRVMVALDKVDREMGTTLGRGQHSGNGDKEERKKGLWSLKT